MTAKEAVEKANALREKFYESKKNHSAWWEKYHAISKKMGEAHAALHVGAITPDEWNAIYGEFHEMFSTERELKSPSHPDAREWYEAKNEALQLLGSENGLHLTIET